ncbi:transferase family domain-containing protein [Trichoderma camerunense]
MGSIAFSEMTLVRPSKAPVPGRISVTPLDQYMVRVILPMMVIFKIDEPSLRPIILQNLKRALSLAIDELTILAADIIPLDPANDTIQLEYGEDAGVWFHVKELPDVDYEDLAQRNFPFSALPASQFAPKPLGHSARSPVMTLQATLIKGGLVLTFGGHHVVMDAQGMGTFVAVWAKHVAAVSEGLVVTEKQQLHHDSLEASQLFGPRMERPLSEFPTYQTGPDRSYEHMQAKILQKAVAGDHDGIAKLIRVSHWAMSQEKLDALRDATVPRTKEEASVTANATLSALIWKQVTRARRLTEKQVASSSLLTSVNVRRRVDPPLAPEYPGNAIALAKANATAEELEAPGVESLYAIAKKVAASIEWWTPDELWSLTGALQTCGNVANKLLPPLNYDVLVTAPARLGDMLKEARWGPELGDIKALRWAFPAFMDGFVIILPSIHGGIEIMLWTAPETAMRLKEDADWTKWVTQLE